MSTGAPTSPPDPHVDWDALARYLAGESSPAEADAMRRWLAEHPADARLFSAVDHVLGRGAAVAGGAGDVDVERALASVRARMDEPAVRPLTRHPGVPADARTADAARWLGRRVRAIGGLAAAASIVAAVSLWRAGSRDASSDASSDAARDAMVAAPARTYTAAVGRRDSLRLPDSTRVLLAPGSRLVVVGDYGTRERVVELTGEALFEVRHVADRPFVVRAGAARVRDIGTAFSVRTDAAAGVTVAVTQGAVALAAADAPPSQETVLRAGEVAVLDSAGRVVALRGADTDDHVSWTRGRLVFRDAPLSDVRAALRRWYGLELRLDDAALADRHFTASFDGESADEVLRVLGLALGADVDRRGDTATVRNRGAPAPPR